MSSSWALGRFWGSIRDFYKELNPATLTGAVDVIVVEQPNGDFSSSPFHVRFGKMGVLRSKEKVVEITINDVQVPIQMKLSDTGEAFFVEEVDHGDEVPVHLATSPLPVSGMELAKRHLEGLRVPEQPNRDRESSVPSTLPERWTSMPKNSASTPGRRKSRSGRQPAGDEEIYLDDLFKDDEIDPQLVDRYLIKRWHKNSTSAAAAASTQAPATTEPGQTAVIKTGQAETTSPLPCPPSNLLPCPSSDRGYGSNPSSIAGTEDRWRWFFDEGRFQELLGDVSISTCAGLEQADDEISEERFNTHIVNYEQLNNNPDLLFSSDLVVRLNGKYYNWRVAGPMLVSLLLFQQPLSESAVNALIDKHQPKAKTHEARDQTRKSSISSATSAVSSYFWWRRATSADPPTKSQNSKMESGTVSDSGQAGAPKQEEHSESKDIDVEAALAMTAREPEPEIEVPLESDIQFGKDEQHSPSISSNTTFDFEDRGALSDSELEESRKMTCKARYKKTSMLTTAQLKSLNLQRGVANKASFSVTTKYQGTSTCECEIWLWHHTDKIVISDIDGTITKSDVLGHIMPRVGVGHWAHVGVAELFNRIAANDYKIMYLTARAIGMASQTKEYLRSVQQDKYSLPYGPLLLAPTSVFSALHSEVIEKKPEIFKTSCLREVAALYPTNPFFAGFGNRPNDTVAYTAAGVPPHRIYIIDPTGRVEFVGKKLEFSGYPKLADLVDHLFPPLKTSPTPEECNSAQYWRPVVQDVEVDLNKFPKPLTTTGKTSTRSSSVGSNQGWTTKKK